MVCVLWDGKIQPSVSLCIRWAAPPLCNPAQMREPTPLQETNRLELYVRPLPIPPSKTGWHLWRAAAHGSVFSSHRRRASYLGIHRGPGGCPTAFAFSALFSFISRPSTSHRRSRHGSDGIIPQDHPRQDIRLILIQL